MLEVDTPVLEQMRQRAHADALPVRKNDGFYQAVHDRALQLAELTEQDTRGNEWRPAEYGPTSFYLLLGVTRESPMWQVEEAYRRFVAENHPDRFPADSDARREAQRRLGEMSSFMADLRGYHLHHRVS
jgi:DnaJ-domain-containing protein 1